MDLIETLTRALLVVLAVGFVLVVLARALGMWEPHRPHPCEIWAATDEGLNLDGCYRAFEVAP